MDIDSIIRNTLQKEAFVPKDRKFHAAILLLLIKIDGIIHIVFQKRSKNIVGAGEIGLPGGKVEPIDKTIKDTVIRETIEEMGITKDDFSVYHRLFRMLPGEYSFIDVYLGYCHLSSLEHFYYNHDEVEDIFSLPLSLFLENKPDHFILENRVIARETINGEEITYFRPLDNINSHRKSQPIWNLSVHIFGFPSEYGYIWGITGEILHIFTEMLQTIEVKPFM